MSRMATQIEKGPVSKTKSIPCALMNALGSPHGGYSEASITPLNMESSSTYPSVQLLQATSESKNRLKPLLCYFHNKDTKAPNNSTTEHRCVCFF